MIPPTGVGLAPPEKLGTTNCIPYAKLLADALTSVKFQRNFGWPRDASTDALVSLDAR
jgi:hypothetical protein